MRLFDFCILPLGSCMAASSTTTQQYWDGSIKGCIATTPFQAPLACYPGETGTRSIIARSPCKDLSVRVTFFRASVAPSSQPSELAKELRWILHVVPRWLSVPAERGAGLVRWAGPNQVAPEGTGPSRISFYGTNMLAERWPRRKLFPVRFTTPEKAWKEEKVAGGAGAGIPSYVRWRRPLLPQAVEEELKSLHVRSPASPRLCPPPLPKRA